MPQGIMEQKINERSDVRFGYRVSNQKNAVMNRTHERFKKESRLGDR